MFGSDNDISFKSWENLSRTIIFSKQVERILVLPIQSSDSPCNWNYNSDIKHETDGASPFRHGVKKTIQELKKTSSRSIEITREMVIKKLYKIRYAAQESRLWGIIMSQSHGICTAKQERKPPEKMESLKKIHGHTKWSSRYNIHKQIRWPKKSSHFSFSKPRVNDRLSMLFHL